MPQHQVTINTYGPDQPVEKFANSARAMARLATQLGATPNIDTVYVRIDPAARDAAQVTEIARDAGWSIG